MSIVAICVPLALRPLHLYASSLVSVWCTRVKTNKL